jgi:CDGSH-type Zn-finger protein
VLPDAGSTDSIASAIVACPSGALHYERKDSSAVETTPERNTIRLVKNGPLYLRGDFAIVNGAGELVVDDTRASLCRCGASANKPFCDNSHKTNGFAAPATSAEPQTNIEPSDVGKLCVETTTNGPLHVTGNFTVLDGKGEPIYQGTDASFCRCGASGNMPFCDSTHNKIGFLAE